MIDPDTWAGSVPQVSGIAPRVRSKHVTWIRGIEFVAHFSAAGNGYGGYNQDHEFFGYRQSI